MASNHSASSPLAGTSLCYVSNKPFTEEARAAELSEIASNLASGVLRNLPQAGESYTRAEFLDFYGSLEQWHAAVPPPAASHAALAEVADEAEGVHPFEAQHRVNGRSVSIGSFATAVEAAVAYARAVGEYQPPAPPTANHRVDGRQVHLGSFATAVEAAVAYARSVGEYQPPAPPAVATEAEGLRLHLSSSNSTGYLGVYPGNSSSLPFQGVWVCCDACGRWCHGECAGMDLQQAEEAEGLRLHLSSSNSTGYKNVFKEPSGRFQANHRVEGRNVGLGIFDTAVEAAVAYARAVGEYQPPAPPAVATEAEGLRLHLSSSSSTGYKGVGEHSRTGRFQAKRMVDGRLVYIGLFDTAVEAAVAYARAAEGLRLHLSSNSTGYKNVFKQASGRFWAQHTVDGGQRFVWTPEMHLRFERAVFQLGVSHARPLAIRRLMGYRRKWETAVAYARTAGQAGGEAGPSAPAAGEPPAVYEPPTPAVAEAAARGGEKPAKRARTAVQRLGHNDSWGEGQASRWASSEQANALSLG
ncbi:hypothetical protein EMIHUDRAFT_214154 [Emiliania huxleyi CCMP1516]|uniref:AP2/ERF domain-containing protein n=2 Tax=Emiliania huxleyi TaxID=2903 RepID=A0A0D3IKP6_EMIH1|nr:hypothetical protein EMIHUDRAFT_214154 [Emiliania huxleyi CCMP1516]EOD11831.1 hypothetical protein EMIHUDRAFT_214154 [Emiliania huxleyi CCMP1516]|eukprot:XP_005764260.1 hypothetical protein EMIHUDRAFT_214154 [Emiliania huxleyi CCMP1516]